MNSEDELLEDLIAEETEVDSLKCTSGSDSSEQRNLLLSHPRAKKAYCSFYYY